MKYSLLTVILSTLVGVSFGFGVARLSLVKTAPAAAASASTAAEPAPIDTTPIVAIDTPEAEEKREKQAEKEAKKAPGAAKKNAAAPPA